MWTLIQGPTLFQEFLPHSDYQYQRILQENCTAPLQAYQASSGTLNGPCDAVNTCLLENVDEITKYYMGVAGILLGLAPSILSILGSQTIETSLLSMKRPALSFLIALGAPVVSPIRLFEYSNPRDILEKRDVGPGTQLQSQNAKVSVSVIQYVMVLAAFTNVTTLGIQIGYSCPSVAVGCSQHFHVLIWTYLAAPIHAIGLLAFSNRAQLESRTVGVVASGDSRSGQNGIAPRIKTTIKTRLKNELVPCLWQEKEGFVWGGESLTYVLLSLFLSILTVGHILYGTAIFSSLLFVGPTDAVIIISRYVASSVICRTVLVFEIAGMRHWGNPNGGENEVPIEVLNADVKKISYTF